MSRYPGLAGKPCAVIPHGSYLPVLQPPMDQMSARQACNLPKTGRIMSSLGAIRRYKNIPLLVRNFRSLHMEDLTLVIAGKCRDEELINEINAEMADAPNVIFRNEFLTDEELQRYNEASDLIVLPYTDILNSGSALFSLSCARPILVPALGSLIELQDAVGRQWVHLFDPPFTPEALQTALSQEATDAKPDLSSLDWQRIGEQTRDFYQALVGAS